MSDQTPRIPDLWWSETHEALVKFGPYLVFMRACGVLPSDELPADAVKLGDVEALRRDLALAQEYIQALVKERDKVRGHFGELRQMIDTELSARLKAERERDARRADIREALGRYFDVDLDDPDRDELDDARDALKRAWIILDS